MQKLVMYENMQKKSIFGTKKKYAKICNIWKYIQMYTKNVNNMQDIMVNIQKNICRKICGNYEEKNVGGKCQKICGKYAG